MISNATWQLYDLILALLIVEIFGIYQTRLHFSCPEICGYHLFHMEPSLFKTMKSGAGCRYILIPSRRTPNLSSPRQRNVVQMAGVNQVSDMITSVVDQGLIT